MAEAFTWGGGGEMLTPESAKARRRVAEALMMQGMDASPVKHWTQGMARVAQAMLGAYDLNQLDRREVAQQKDANDIYANDPAIKAAMPAMSQPATASAPQSGIDRLTNAMLGPASANRTYTNDEVSPLDPTPERMGLPRGMRNNNPLNIEAGSFTQGMPGFVGSDDRFAKFETMDHGVAAANKLLDTYRDKHGLNTVNGILNRWAPTSDGNNVSAYATSVSKQLGINPNAPIPPEMRPQLIAAMGQHENGRPIGPVNLASAPAAAGDPAALPANSQPAQYVVPGQAGATAQPYRPQSAGTVTPEMQAWFQRAIKNPATRAYAMQRMGELVKPSHPTFGETGAIDPQTGQPVRGWIDPVRRTVTPYVPPQMSGGESVIPNVPPGVDPKVWREAHSKSVTSNALPAASDDVSKLRNEVRQLPSYKSMAEVAPRFQSMVTASKRDNRAADLTLVYGLMKILDPTSVVRESEAAMAQNVATLPENYRAQVQSFLTGQGRLAPDVRAALLQEAHGAAQSYQEQFGRDVEQYRGIATRYRMNHDDVIPSFGSLDAEPAAPALPQGGTEPPRIRKFNPATGRLE